MSNFSSSYFDDYEFEPDLRNGGPYHERAKENVERAYNTYRKGIPLFIASACLVYRDPPSYYSWTKYFSYESRDQYEPELAKRRSRWQLTPRGPVFCDKEPEVSQTSDSSGRPQAEHVNAEAIPQQEDEDELIEDVVEAKRRERRAPDVDAAGDHTSEREETQALRQTHLRDRQRIVSEEPPSEHHDILTLLPRTEGQDRSTRQTTERREHSGITRVQRQEQQHTPAIASSSVSRDIRSNESAYSIKDMLKARRESARAQLIALETMSDDAEDVMDDVVQEQTSPIRATVTRRSSSDKTAHEEARKATNLQQESTGVLNQGFQEQRYEEDGKTQNVLRKAGIASSRSVTKTRQAGAARTGLPTPDDSGEGAGLQSTEVVDDTFTQATDEMKSPNVGRKLDGYQDQQAHNRPQDIPSNFGNKAFYLSATEEDVAANLPVTTQQSEQYAPVTWTAANADAYAAALHNSSRALPSQPSGLSEQDTVKAGQGRPVKQIKSSTTGRATTAASTKPVKMCLECHTTETGGWRKGPGGPASLCLDCGRIYNNLRRKMARAAAKAQRDLVPEPAVDVPYERRATSSPRQPNADVITNAAEAMSRTQPPSGTSSNSAEEVDGNQPAGADRNVGGLSHKDVLHKVFHKSLDDAVRLNGKLDELVGSVEYQRLLDARLKPVVSPYAITAQPARAKDRSNEPENDINFAGTKHRAKRLMTFDTPPVTHKAKRIRLDMQVGERINAEAPNLGHTDDQEDVDLRPERENAIQSGDDFAPEAMPTGQNADVSTAQEQEEPGSGLPTTHVKVSQIAAIERTTLARSSSKQRQQATPRFLSSSQPSKGPSQHDQLSSASHKESTILSTQALLLEAGQAFRDEYNSPVPPPEEVTTGSPPVSASKAVSSSRKAAATPHIRRRRPSTTPPTTTQSAQSPSSFLADDAADEAVPADTQAMLNGFHWQHSDSQVDIDTQSMNNATASARRITFRSSPLSTRDTPTLIDQTSNASLSVSRKKGALKRIAKKDSISTPTPLSQGLFNFSKITDHPMTQGTGTQESQSMFDIDAFLDNTGILDTSVHM